MNFVFVDTVGFIRDLPTTLIDAFKSTLDEIIYSDLILHVRDISSQYYLEQRNEVIKITNGDETKEMKYKKAKPLIDSGEWRIT